MRLITRRDKLDLADTFNVAVTNKLAMQKGNVMKQEVGRYSVLEHLRGIRHADSVSRVGRFGKGLVQVRWWEAGEKGAQEGGGFLKPFNAVRRQAGNKREGE